MQLRLWHRLLIGNVVLSVVLLAGLAVWLGYSFRRGFSAYLDAIATEQAEAAAVRLERAYAAEGDWTFLRRDDGRFGALVGGREQGGRRPSDRPDRMPANDPNDVGPNPSSRRQPFELRPKDQGEPVPALDHASGPDQRPDGSPSQPVGPTPWNRLRLLDADRNVVAGLPQQHEVLVEIPLRYEGRLIGYLQVPQVRTLNLGPEQAFSRLQQQALVVALLVAVLLSVALSLWLARSLTRPLRALQAGIESFSANSKPLAVPVERRDELGALAQSFNAMTQSLHQLQLERARWTRDIAHELRTPVTILQAEIQAMVDGIRPATPEQLRQLHTECHRLGRLAEDLSLLDLDRVPGFACQRVDVDLATLVEAAVDRFRARMSDRGLQLDCPKLQATRVFADPDRLAQVLDNVFENALRYTDAPGSVRVALETKSDQALLSIDDSAPGVPDTALPLLFERLYRVESSRARSAAGAGLGLSIAASIVAAHDGEITAEQSLLGGLRIVIQLPLNG